MVCFTKAYYQQAYPEIDVYTVLCVQCMWRDDCYYRRPQYHEKDNEEVTE